MPPEALEREKLREKESACCAKGQGRASPLFADATPICIGYHAWATTPICRVPCVHVSAATHGSADFGRGLPCLHSVPLHLLYISAQHSYGSCARCTGGACRLLS